MPTLIIRHFGGLRLSCPGADGSLPPQFPRSLFSYLSSHPGKVFCRSFLTDLLWPDLPAPRARRALSTALWRLRANDPVARHLCHPSRDTVCLQVPRQTWIDTIAFEHKLKQATGCAETTPDRALRLVTSAADIYANTAFSDISAEWALLERTRLENTFCDVLFLASQLNFDARNFRTSEQFATRLIGYEPFREDIRKIQIHAVCRSGNMVRAQQMYGEFTTFLADELGEHPSFQFKELGRPKKINHFEIKPKQGHVRQHVRHLQNALRRLDSDLERFNPSEQEGFD